MKPTLLALAVLFAATPARAEKPFGAVATPLVRGGQAAYAIAGYPEIRAGFRQGLADLELGGEVGFDWVSTDFFGTVTGRRTFLDSGALTLTADGKLGAFATAGSQWADRDNRSGAGLRLEVGTTLSYHTTWPVSFLAFLKVPAEIPFTSDGMVRVKALLGGGAEVSITKDLFLAVDGGFGPDFRTRVPEATRLAVEAMIGFGYRMF